VGVNQLNARSLLDYLDAPVLVGDPDGRVVHLNPSFESRFDVSLETAQGGLVASVFDGGAREAVLRAVAEVLGGAGAVRFQLREAGCGYTAVASPISTETDRIGVVILLTQETTGDQRMIECAKSLQGPLDELTQCLGEFAEQVGGRRANRYREMLDDAATAVDSLQKWAGELQSLVCGSSAKR
jgi:nitrogen-specific signal transduction histidine kinase